MAEVALVEVSSIAPDDEEVANMEMMGQGNRAFSIALGLEWECGHWRAEENTHVIGGLAQCKVCRRRRWMRGFRVSLARIALREEARAHSFKDRAQRREQHNLSQAFALATRPANGRYPLDTVFSIVCRNFDVSREDLVSNKRFQVLCRGRSVVAKVLRERGLSYPVIGKLIGGRDHSSVIHTVKRFDDYVKQDPRVQLSYLEARDDR